MIGFHMTVGYCSGYLTDMSDEDQWEQLVKSARNVANDYPELFSEYIHHFGFPLSVLDTEHRSPEAFALVYLNNGGLTILKDKQEIMILASASGDSRKAKESIALAVCQLTMFDCAKLGITVNLVTA